MPIALDEIQDKPINFYSSPSSIGPPSSFAQAKKVKLLDALNPVQREAVMQREGSLLIFAGAGSGKTRVITYRIAYLNQIHGIAPWNIAAVTFTNKAAAEMRSRLEELMGPLAKHVFVRTFHSLGLYILSRHPEFLGLKSGFSVIDQSAQKSLLKTILKEGKYEQDNLEPAMIVNQINQARDSMLPPGEIGESKNPHAEAIAEIYKIYIRRLRNNNSVDFSDLLYETARLLETQPKLCQKYSELWHYFMIDEYQDTNHVQYLVGKMICQKHKNIMVVGDDDQSIYSWRGANIGNILHFEKDYPKTKILKLEQNYRSTATILKAASSLISHNKQRREKTLFTKEKKFDLPISCQSYETETDEAREIVQKILYHQEQNLDLNQIAIFYRTNAQSRIFERLLRENNLPYIIVGDTRFYDRKEIKDLLAYLNVIINPEDDLSLERIINVPPRGIGVKRLDSLRSLAKENKQSLFDAAGQGKSLPFPGTEKITTLHKLFCDWNSLHLAGELPSILAEKVLEESGYLKALKAGDTHESSGRLENLYELIASIKEYERECKEELSSVYDLEQNPLDLELKHNEKGVYLEGDTKLEAESTTNEKINEHNDLRKKPSLNKFLQRVALYTTEEKSDQPEQNSFLYLMTLHNAKGLEFPCVFLSGVEEDYIPHALSKEDDEIEEERRLLYVGITRGEKYLYISHVRQRWLFGQLKQRQPSRFLREIDDEVFASAESSSHSHLHSAGFALSSRSKHNNDIPTKNTNINHPFGGSLPNYLLKEEVFHARYGKGIIVKVEPLAIGQKLGILFAKQQKEKFFSSQYTPLKKI